MNTGQPCSAHSVWACPQSNSDQAHWAPWGSHPTPGSACLLSLIAHPASSSPFLRDLHFNWGLLTVSIFVAQKQVCLTVGFLTPCKVSKPVSLMGSYLSWQSSVLPITALATAL